MMDRDSRWEKVWASVAPYVWPYEDEVVPNYPVTEFLFEVAYFDTVWYCRILIHDDDLAQFPDLYNITLDNMVKNIDGRLENV